ncbi:MAG TPA: TIGR04222 domain-containing membrane protein [Burkholderiales bacterium]|nr:TIGR04222 domain-containing membrane protein [Burkholderiales bacterium]
MPNPFLLTGFNFLLFYFVLGVLINWGLRHWLQKKEMEEFVRKPQMTDPYQIAYLRGGDREALSIATVALIDRGLLKAEGEVLQARDNLAVDLVNRPIEKAVLKRYSLAGNADEVFTDPGARAACNEYRKELIKHRMIADSVLYRQRLAPALLAIAGLLLVTVIKVQIAFSQGRHNVMFLIILTVIFCIAVFVALGARTTGRGKAMLEDLKTLFARLQQRSKTIQSGGQTNDAVLLAAVFGINTLPTANFPFIKNLYPSKSSDSGGSSCGSSSSSDGGSCGGGGCGGGCGG